MMLQRYVASVWRMLQYDECFSMMGASVLWRFSNMLLQYDGCFSMTNASVWWVLRYDHAIILLHYNDSSVWRCFSMTMLQYDHASVWRCFSMTMLQYDHASVWWYFSMMILQYDDTMTYASVLRSFSMLMFQYNTCFSLKRGLCSLKNNGCCTNLSMVQYILISIVI